MLYTYPAMPAVIKPDPLQEVVQKVIPYRLYWFASYLNIVIQYRTPSNFERYDFCNALDHIFDAKQCHWTSFQASCMCTFQSMFCTRFIIASKYAHLVHVSRVFHLFSKRACLSASFIKTIRHGKYSNRSTATRPQFRVRIELDQIQDCRLECLNVRFSCSISKYGSS